MYVKSSVILSFIGIFSLIVFCVPDCVFCAQWREFYAEKWDYKSEKLNKNLKFKNVFFYDADNLVRGKNGEVTVWVKELAKNDRYYVAKGVPE